MLTLPQLIEACNALYPPVNDCAPHGLQVAGCREIDRVAVAVTADLRTIQRASEEGCQALIVHHGLYWDKSSPCLVEWLGRRAGALMRTGISLLAYHLPMDLHQEVGNNWPAARDLGLAHLQPFGSCGAHRLGVIGEADEASVGEWLAKVGEYYGSTVRWAKAARPKVRRVAIVSGAGQRYIEEAQQARADLLITGVADEPQWHLAKELDVHFFAVGHAASERVGPRRLADWLQERLPVQARFLMDDNPF
ncbi:MAG: Nif3-like dinuclear metal center hexameric protein [Chlamydiia bacterium]